MTAGSIKLNETGTLASTIAMSGGVLDADESSGSIRSTES